MALDVGYDGTIRFGRTEAILVAVVLFWLLFWAWKVVGTRSVPRGHWLYEAVVKGPSRFMPPPEAAGRWGLMSLGGALGIIFSSPVYKTGYLLLRWPGVVLALAACVLLYLWLFRTWSARPLRQTVLMSMAFAAILSIPLGAFWQVSMLMVPHCQPLAWTAVPGERDVNLATEEPRARLVLTQLHYSQPCDQHYKDYRGREVAGMNLLAVLENRGTLPIGVQYMDVEVDGLTAIWQPRFWELAFPVLPPGGRVAFAGRVEDADLPVWPSPAVSLGDFTAITHPVTESVAASVTLVPVDVSGTLDWGGWGWSEYMFPAYTVSGHVRNDGADEACDFDAYIAVYDARNQLVGAGNTYFRSGEAGVNPALILRCLAPGATAEFGLSLDGLAGMADHYDVWFQVRPE